MTLPSLNREKALTKQGFQLIAGIDEAGRGPLAGPVVAAAVILKKKIKGVNDSKLLSPAKRAELYKLIKDQALAIGVGIVSSQVIDNVNIYQATRLAMVQAVLAIKLVPDYLLIDGKIKLDIDIAQNFVVGGDGKSSSIAAASIVAKVVRDKIMQQYHQKYPDYGFDRHKGYGTKHHFKKLFEYGPCAIHRLSFSPVSLARQ